MRAPINRRNPAPAALRRRESVRRLKDAMAADRLVLHYQPIVSVPSFRPIAAEALLRWSDPDREPETVQDLIAAAETSPIIFALARWTIACCGRDASGWARPPNGLRLNVNLSARELGRPRLANRMCALFGKAGLPSSCVNLEITETSAIRDPDTAVRDLQGLKDAGFGLWLDDFGTGHSSLEWLWRLPVDGLKIPRTFVEHVTRGGPAAVITRAVIDLAHRLRLQVVAEGVETEEQRDWLKSAGCDALQGYLYGPPLDPHQATQLFT